MTRRRTSGSLPLLATALTASLAFSGCEQSSKAKNAIFGEVEADEVDVSSRLPGRIRKILVQPGQKVKAGDVLVTFEDDLMQAKKAGALATIAAAESRRDIAEDAVRPEEKEQIRAAVATARRQMEFAKVSLDRTAQLLKEGAVAQQTFDEVQFKYQAAVEQFNSAKAKQTMATSGARMEEKAAAQALVEQAKTLLAEVEAYEKDLNLAAPVDGEVLNILNHEGELIPTGYPVVTLLRMDRPRVVVNIPEIKVSELKKDSTVKLHIPALGPQVSEGKVTYVAALGNFATKTFTQDRSSFDLKTFEVRISFTSPPEGLRPGMTAEVRKTP